MSKRGLALLAAGVVIQCVAFAVPTAEATKEFPEYRCRLSLSGTDFQWLDHTQIPQAAAAMRNSSGITAILVAIKVEDSFVLNTKGFDDGLCAPGVAAKLKSRETTFRGVPCYEICVRFEQQKALAAIRAFAANGFLYQVQFIGESLAIDDPNKLDGLFSMFEFIGTPALPVAKAPSPQQQAYKFSENMGRIAALCIIGIVLLALAKKAMGRKKSS